MRLKSPVRFGTGEKAEELNPEPYLLSFSGNDITAISSPQRFIFDGQTVNVAAYNINGYNYFRLRDIAILLDFNVDWQGDGGVIELDLSKEYTED